MKRISTIIIVALLSLTACKKEASTGGAGQGKFGMMQNDSAEGAALEFFDSIYNKRDLNIALKYSTPKMARLLRSYHTTKAVARHVINLRYESKVKLEIDAGDNVGRQQYATKQQVSIYFSGTYQGNTIDELRTVRMIREDGLWKVDAILADRYS